MIGAFVASLKGGLVYNTWPMMNGALIPDDLFALEPWYHNSFENPVMAQFNPSPDRLHVVLAVAVEAWRTFGTDTDAERRTSARHLMLAVVLGQAALGIWTLLEAVPIGLGIAHQACAAILLVIAIRHLHIVSRQAERGRHEARYQARFNPGGCGSDEGIFDANVAIAKAPPTSMTLKNRTIAKPPRGFGRPRRSAIPRCTAGNTGRFLGTCVRGLKPQHQPDVLHGSARRALAEIVEARDQQPPARGPPAETRTARAGRSH